MVFSSSSQYYVNFIDFFQASLKGPCQSTLAKDIIALAQQSSITTERIVQFFDSNQDALKNDLHFKILMQKICYHFSSIFILNKPSESDALAGCINRFISSEEIKKSPRLMLAYQCFLKTFPHCGNQITVKGRDHSVDIPETLFRAQWSLEELFQVSDSKEIILPDALDQASDHLDTFKKCILGDSPPFDDEQITKNITQLADFFGVSSILQCLVRDKLNARKNRSVGQVIRNISEVKANIDPSLQPKATQKLQVIRLALRRGDYSDLDGTDPTTARLIEILEKTKSKSNNIQFCDMSIQGKKLQTMCVKKSFNIGSGAMSMKKIDDLRFLLDETGIEHIYLGRANYSVDDLIEVVQKTPKVKYLSLRNQNLDSNDLQRIKQIPHITVMKI